MTAYPQLQLFLLHLNSSIFAFYIIFQGAAVDTMFFGAMAIQVHSIGTPLLCTGNDRPVTDPVL